MRPKLFRLSQILLAAFMMTAAFSCRTSAEGGEAEILTPDDTDMTLEATQWADSILNRMSLRQQVAQLVMPAIYTSADTLTLERIAYYVEDLNVGSILLLKGDVASAVAISDSIIKSGSRLDIYPGTILAIDAENGLGMRLEDAPAFPWNSSLKNDVDEQSMFDYGKEIGRECRGLGINMILGPVLDVNRENSRGVMRKRSMGSDADRVSSLGEAYAKGLESMGVMSVGKHFPGHGATSTDTHRDMASISIPADELMSKDLVPFSEFARKSLAGIMVGHLWVQSLDSVKRPASFSPVVITDILRGKLNFEGLVLVDAVVMGGASGYKGSDAVAAGADIIIAPHDTAGEIEDIVKAVEEGRISTSDIADRCRRVLFHKYIYGVPFRQEKESILAGEDLDEFLYKDTDSIKKRLSSRR